jgi:hypothetical protein
LQQLVAPIALYPDALVAQILAASTYPTQIVEAERWLEQNSNLQGDNLAAEVDKQTWDPSVKALTQFPSVLGNMNTNLSWTSALGDAYYNQQQDVLTEIQVLRKRAQNAGTLKSSPQETVTTQDQSIIIEPAEPETVYVPTYDPWIVYGPPLPIYPGYYYDGSLDYPFIAYGPGIGLGLGFGGFGWGWNAWDFDWRHHRVDFDHAPFISRSQSFSHRFPGANRPGFSTPGRFGHSDDRGAANMGGSDRGRAGTSSTPDIGRGRSDSSPTTGMGTDQRGARGFGESRPDMGIRSGAFSGFGEGGNERGFSSRGQSSFGAGHGFGGGFGIGGGHGFGGGMHGGGGGGRGGHR